jgi:hypothetical protein
LLAQWEAALEAHPFEIVPATAKPFLLVCWAHVLDIFVRVACTALVQPRGIIRHGDLVFKELAPHAKLLDHVAEASAHGKQRLFEELVIWPLCSALLPVAPMQHCLRQRLIILGAAAADYAYILSLQPRFLHLATESVCHFDPLAFVA